MSKFSKGDLRQSAAVPLQFSSSSAEPGTARQSSEPERLRRLAYLHRIGQRHAAALASSQPCRPSKSYREPLEERASHKPSTPQVRSRPERSLPQAMDLQPISAPQTARSTVSPSLSRLKIPFSYLAYDYIRLAAKISTGIFLTVNCLYIGSVITLGNPAKLPRAYVGVTQAIVQGMRCGWSAPVEAEGWGCLNAPGSRVKPSTKPR